MAYPVNLEFDAPPDVARWRPLVSWLLAIPHLLIANVLSNLGSVVAVISWFFVVLTGAVPVGLVNLQCLVIRYQLRAYSYVLWLREAYPAFDFTMTPEDPGGDPLQVEIEPRLEDRNRLTAGLRIIWAIPIILFMMVVSVGAFFAVVAGFFAVLFTGRWPDGLRTYLIGAGRLSARVTAYVYLLVDDYPPFTLSSTVDHAGAPGGVADR